MALTPSQPAVQTSVTNATADVLVIGGGPVGSLAAYLLAQAGVDVVLIDSNSEPVLDYRASTFHPPTLDLLGPSGVAAALVERGLKCPIIQYRDRKSGPVAELDLSILAGDTDHPYRLQCEQFKLTAWLQAQLEQLPSARLCLGYDVNTIATDANGVTVTTTGPDDTITQWQARYAIGCDGARSTVRSQLGIEFPGFTHPDQFLVAGTRFDFKAGMGNIRSVNYTADPQEWFLLLEIPDMWRVVVPVPVDVAESDARSDDYIQACLQNICPSPTPHEILVKSVYRVHQRVASTYRSGSVLLAGDAAHVNNPIGGMGLNGGIHDVLVLCPMLARQLDGSAPSDDLDDYETIRRPMAINDISGQTERNKKLMEERDPAVRAENNRQLRETCADPELAYRYALEVSMIRSLRDAGLLQRPTAQVRSA